MSDDWFVSLDTSLVPTRNADDAIDRHGLLVPVSEQSLPGDDPSDAPKDDPSSGDKPSPPAPGDDSNLLIFGTLLVLAALSILLLIRRDRKA